MRALTTFLSLLSTCLLAHAADDGLPPPPPFDEAIDNGTLGWYPKRTYHTVPFTSPYVNFLQYSPECDDGLYYFITPRGWSLQKEPGPMIIDGRGEVVWFQHYDNEFGGEAYNFLVQKYRGEDHLTLWLGDDRVRGHGAGNYYLLNSSYDTVTSFGGGNNLKADLHEFLITPEGTALLTLYEIVPWDVTPLRSFNSMDPNDREPNWVWDGIFQEIDIDSGEVKFQWRATEHLEITETYRGIGDGGTRGNPFDWYHINSAQKDSLGNYIVSARYPHSIIYIDGKTKKRIWQLGGKKNSFMDLSGGNATNFAWQHDARFHDKHDFPNLYTPPPEREGYTTKLVSLFDNAAEDQHYQFGLPLSRGLLLEVTYPTPGTEKARAGSERVEKPTIAVKTEENEDEDEDDNGNDLSKRDGEGNAAKIAAINGTDPDYTVRVIMSYDNPNRIRSSSQGSMQLLKQEGGKDPRVLVGYGLDAAWTEFAADGSVLCDVHYGAATSFDTAHMQSYRAFKFAWTGRPRWPPAAKISEDDGEVYVSWNGATDIREWVLQRSNIRSEEDRDWKEVTRVPKIDFETTIPIVMEKVGDARYLRLVAYTDKKQRMEYGTSPILDRGIMASYFPKINDNLKDSEEYVAKKASTVSSPLKIILILVANVCVLFILYELYRRYLSWRIGRPGGGPLLRMGWGRKEAKYSLLSEA